jgi:GNAT superfamily N-acetyltransferase
MDIPVRQAVTADIPRIEKLIDASVRGLQARDYTPQQIEAALRSVFTVDSRLIADGTYLVADREAAPELAGCGGWSKRKTLFGGDRFSKREDDLLHPAHDAARIRAFFVHPAHARRGIAGAILEACENAAIAAGFTRFELGATLTGVPFYLAKGYSALDRVDVPLAGAPALTVIRMQKSAAR